MTLKTALISLQSLLFDAVPNDPQDAEVAKHYISNRAGFDQTAREWTKKYASGQPVQDDEAGLSQETIQRILEMGFERASIVKGLRKFNGDEMKTVEGLLAGEL